MPFAPQVAAPPLSQRRCRPAPDSPTTAGPRSMALRYLDGVEGIQACAVAPALAGELAEVKHVRRGPTVAGPRQEVENLVEAVNVLAHVVGELGDGSHDDMLLVRGDAR